jgi:hypothetical protein
MGRVTHIARSFYTSLDFKVLGPAHECAPEKAMSPSDVVLIRELAATASRRSQTPAPISGTNLTWKSHERFGLLNFRAKWEIRFVTQSAI